MKREWILIAVIILLSAVILYCGYLYLNYQNKFITGLWSESEDFASRAGIDGMFLYIGEPEGINPLVQSYRAYLIMHTDGKVIADYKFMLTISFMRGVKVEPLPEAGETQDNINKILPRHMNMNLELVQGKLTWSDSETIYAELYKNCLAQE